MSTVQFIVITVVIVGLVRLIIWAGAVHDRRACTVPDCVMCRLNQLVGGGDR